MTDRENFIHWAAKAGYDTAHAYDTERSRWVFWNPMTADLWTAWQAAAAHEREKWARLVLDDAHAITFQTIGQYRTALAAAIRGRADEHL